MILEERLRRYLGAHKGFTVRAKDCEGHMFEFSFME